MKKILIVILIISVTANIYFSYKKVNSYFWKKHLFEVMEIKDIPYQEGLNSFNEEFKSKYPQLYASGKKCFFSTWDTITLRPVSGINYMLQLDSLAGVSDKGNTCFIFVSEMQDNDINTYLSNRHIAFKNFILMNNLHDFVSGVYNYHHKKDKSHLLQFIIDRKGTFLYYNDKVNHSLASDTALHRLLNPIQ